VPGARHDFRYELRQPKGTTTGWQARHTITTAGKLNLKGSVEPSELRPLRV